MGKLLVKEKEIVVPGETLAEGMDYLPGSGTYREGEKILAEFAKAELDIIVNMNNKKNHETVEYIEQNN